MARTLCPVGIPLANDQRLLMLLEAQTRGYFGVVGMLMNQIRFLWNSFDRWYDGDLVQSHAARSASLTESAQRAVRSQTKSYFKFVYDQFQDLDFPTDAEIEAANEDALDRVVNPLEEWNRPAEQYRYARSTGVDDGEAIRIALDRAETLADTDMELAMRNSAGRILAATPKITGYRRVLHPELSESKQSCGLCIAASTRIYQKEKLLPIHEHCNCGVMPIVGDEDPGNTFNLDDLKLLYEALEETGKAELSRIRFKVDEHGELGPVLREEGAKSRIKKSKPITRRESIAAQIPSLEASLARLRERSKNGEDLREPINWQEDRLRVLKAELTQIDKPRRKR